MTSKEDLSLLHSSDQDELDTLHLVYDRRTDEQARGGADEARPGADTAAGDARAPAAGGRMGRKPGSLLKWRSLGAFWAFLLAVTGIGAVALSLAGPPRLPAHRAPPPERAAQVPAVPAQPPASVPAVALPAPPPEKAATAAMPPTPEPQPVVPVRPPPPPPPTVSGAAEPATVSETVRPQAGPAAAVRQAASPEAIRPTPKPAAAPVVPATERPPGGIGAAGAAQPALVIHYPGGSLDGATDAQRLAASADALSPGGAVTTEPEEAAPPAVATITYYEERDHNTARALGKMVQALKYKWRIERGPGSADDAPAKVEVWLPAK